MQYWSVWTPCVVAVFTPVAAAMGGSSREASLRRKGVLVAVVICRGASRSMTTVALVTERVLVAGMISCAATSSTMIIRMAAVARHAD